MMKELKIVSVMAFVVLAGCSSINTHTTHSQPKPINVPSHPYPKGAVETKTGGYVRLKFDIDESGKTDNIKVINSEPKGVFDDSAKKTVSQMVFPKNHATKDATYRINYSTVDVNNL